MKEGNAGIQNFISGINTLPLLAFFRHIIILLKYILIFSYSIFMDWTLGGNMIT
jgi:hypothetical protein